eukprot:3553050-Rhodomonas_salina.1
MSLQESPMPSDARKRVRTALGVRLQMAEGTSMEIDESEDVRKAADSHEEHSIHHLLHECDDLLMQLEASGEDPKAAASHQESSKAESDGLLTQIEVIEMIHAFVQEVQEEALSKGRVCFWVDPPPRWNAAVDGMVWLEKEKKALHQAYVGQPQPEARFFDAWLKERRSIDAVRTSDGLKTLRRVMFPRRFDSVLDLTSEAFF